METLMLVLHNKKNKQVNSENCQFACLDINILEGLRVLFGIPIHLIILLIGIPLYNIDYVKLQNESIKLKQQKIENEIKSQNGHKYQDVQFLRYLQNNKIQFLNADFSFQEDTELLTLAKQIQDGSLNIAQSEDDKQYVKIDLQEKLYDSLFKRIEEYFISKLDMDKDVIKSLENNFRSFVTMNKHIHFQKQNTRNYGKPESVLKDLQRQSCDKQKELGNLINNELKSGLSLLEKIGLKNKIKEVSKINQLSYTFYKPKVARKRVGGQDTFEEVWLRTISIPTKFYFWKIVFFFAASYFYIHKFMNSCLYFAIYSPFGLKSAILSKQFASAFLVDQHTGKIKDDPAHMEDSVTVIYTDIRKQAKKNVQNFENEPDHGLLGKSITRICNRLENWFFRYFILGFILTNILLRLIFLTIGLVSLMFVPLSIAIAPIYAFICAIICLVCLDFTVPSNHQSWDLPIFAPLFDLLIWRLFVRGMGQIAMSIIMAVFHFAFGIFLVIFGIVMYIFRRVLDFFVFLFIYSCGRIPGGDSFLAWRISRQRNLQNSMLNESAISRRQNNNLNEQTLDQLSYYQLQQLIDAEFHRQLLEQYRIQMNLKIDQPVQENDNKLKQLIKYIPFDFPKTKLQQDYSEPSDKLRKLLTDQIAQRKKLLPVIQKQSSSNYKYKHEELLSIFYQLQTYLSETYGQKPLFKKFMWNSFKCEENNYSDLALHFFNIIFFDGRSQINQVLEKLTLKEQKNNAHIKQQLDEFLSQKYKTNTKQIDPPSFITFSQFIEKTLKRFDPSQPLLNLRNDFMLCEDFMLLNVNHLKGNHEI